MVVEIEIKKFDETVEAKTEDEESRILEEIKEITAEGNDVSVYTFERTFNA